MSWDPGPRPAWVRHALDGEGGPELAFAAERLDANQLVDEARLRAGTELGDDSYRAPLDVLVRSIEDETSLHIVGRWRVRELVLRYLESRGRVAACVAADPTIEDAAIEAPIVVTGSPRAGTSIMHELLASHPAHRAPMAWEYWSPAPPPDPARHDTDPRIVLADRDVRLTAALVPGFDGMHEQGARIPREDASAMGLDVRSDVLGAHYGVPSYRKYLAADDMRSAYAWHRRVLLVLQHRFPARRWVVKWPGHVNHVEVLLETYPDARIVVCHRDPVAMLSSVSSLVANLRWAHADSVDFQEIAREQAEVFAEQCDRLLRWRSEVTVDPTRVVDVRFDELVADQGGVVARVYDQLEIPLPSEARQRVADLLAAKPRGRHGGHEHTFADLGLDLAEQRSRFAAYQEHFGIRSE
jgi:sulfotransferase family protein